MITSELDVAATPFRLSWPALFGGFFAAAGVWLLFHALGVALGLSTVDVSSTTDSLRAAGIRSGIWSIVSSFVALFIGGATTARTAGIVGRGNSATHGLVLWGVSTCFTLLIAQSAASSLSGAALSFGPAAGASSGQQQHLGAEAPSKPHSDADADDIVAPMLERPAGSATATTSTSASLERVSSTPELRQSAELRASRDQVLRFVRGMSWALFGAMALSLVGAILGAMAGVSRRQRELSAQVRESISQRHLVTATH